MKQLRTFLMAGYLAIFAAGCATPPNYEQAASSFPPISPGQGRIYFYRDGKFYGSGSGAAVELNGQVVGWQWGAFFFYVDRPAGNYVLTSPSSLVSKYHINFILGDGETKYVSFKWKFALVGANSEPTLEDKDSALQTLSKCLYNPNATNRIFNHPPGE